MSEDSDSESEQVIAMKVTQKTKQKVGCLQPKNRFQERDPFSDLTLVVEDQKLHVHKTLLMIHSPVFQTMLTGDFKEKDLSEIPLPGKKYSAVVGLLEQIYPGNGVDLIKDETLVELLKLADEYDMQQVFHNCRQYIGKQLYECQGKLTTDRIMLYLWVVEKYEKLRSYRQELVYRASRINALEVASSQHYLSVPATATRDFFLLRMALAESYPTSAINHLSQIDQKTWRQIMNKVLR